GCARRPASGGESQRDAWTWQKPLMAGAIQVFPALALLDHRLEIFEPDDTILHRVLDDGAGETRRQIVGLQLAIAVVACHGEAIAPYRDRLGGRERASGGLPFRLAISRVALAE